MAGNPEALTASGSNSNPIALKTRTQLEQPSSTTEVEFKS